MHKFCSVVFPLSSLHSIIWSLSFLISSFMVRHLPCKISWHHSDDCPHKYQIQLFVWLLVAGIQGHYSIANLDVCPRSSCWDQAYVCTNIQNLWWTNIQNVWWCIFWLSTSMATYRNLSNLCGSSSSYIKG